MNVTTYKTERGRRVCVELAGEAIVLHVVKARELRDELTRVIDEIAAVDSLEIAQQKAGA